MKLHQKKVTKSIDFKFFQGNLASRQLYRESTDFWRPLYFNKHKRVTRAVSNNEEKKLFMSFFIIISPGMVSWPLLHVFFSLCELLILIKNLL